MTNFEKAQEISQDCYMPDVGFNREDLYSSAMAMAEWKEQQMIDKACEFIAEWFYNHPHANMVCSDEFESVDNLLEIFKKTMKE